MPILLIEDNPADAYLVKTYLNDASVRHELFHADTLFEGLNTLRERDIQMVLLDLKLPDSDGFKTLTTLMERSSNVPVIVMTGMNNEIVGNQAVRAGAQDFWSKASSTAGSSAAPSATPNSVSKNSKNGTKPSKASPSPKSDMPRPRAWAVSATGTWTS